MSDGKKINELRSRYVMAMHAVQTGVLMVMELDGGPGAGETSPKHLRVGINSAMVDHGALARVLIDKGLISELEYVEAILRQAEQEKAMYEKTLTARMGKKVTLG